MSNNNNSMTWAKLLREIEANWKELQDYLESLTEEQLTGPTDAAGWSAKDHVSHLAVWVNAGRLHLEGQSKHVVLDIRPEVWEQGEDPINAVLYKRLQEMPLDEALQNLRQNHDFFLKKLDTMSEEDLQLPHSHYQSGSTEKRPIIDFVFWDTADHYREHIPWIKAIIENNSQKSRV